MPFVKLQGQWKPFTSPYTIGHNNMYLNLTVFNRSILEVTFKLYKSRDKHKRARKNLSDEKKKIYGNILTSFTMVENNKFYQNKLCVMIPYYAKSHNMKNITGFQTVRERLGYQRWNWNISNFSTLLKH